MTAGNKFFDDMSKLMTNAMGVGRFGTTPVCAATA